MSDEFELPVNYKGNAMNFPASLVTYGYSYKIQVDVHGIMISYERDDEGRFRAVLSNSDLSAEKHIDRALVAVVGEKLEALFDDERIQ